MRRLSAVLPLIVMFAAALLAPLTLRRVSTLVDDTDASYLPSLGSRLSRKPFRDAPIEELRYGDPRWVLIGDSMLGTRIDPVLLGGISGTGDRNALLLVQAASGPAYWYLAFKNYVVASGTRPDVTFFFFRDTNMTDTMFRLESQVGDALDEVAHGLEPELDAMVAARQRGAASPVDRVLNRVYDLDRASAWLHRHVRQWHATRKYPEPDTRRRFERGIEDYFNQNFRRDVAGDLGGENERADFNRDLPTSVLPLIVDLARRHRLPVCFVRVQRRPVGDKPPHQSPVLERYMDDFRAWARHEGVYFHDEQGDPELTLDLYEDGDHFANRAAYTRIFRRRLDVLLR